MPVKCSTSRHQAVIPAGGVDHETIFEATDRAARPMRDVHLENTLSA
jgi:hypothetical protein